MIMTPPGRSSDTRVGIACRRCAPSRCIHTAEHQEVKCLAARLETSKLRQVIVEPFDQRRGMQGHSGKAHRIGRLNSDHAVAHRCEPGRVSPGARADVEHIGRRLRYQMQDIPVIFRRGNAFVTLEQLFRLVGVALGATDR